MFGCTVYAFGLVCGEYCLRMWQLTLPMVVNCKYYMS